jgi:hypothetical protein
MLDEVQDKVRIFLRGFAVMSDPVAVREKGHALIAKFPDDEIVKVAALLTAHNPLFLPDFGNVAGLKASQDQFMDWVMRLKLTAANARQPNILLAAAPKSASSFIFAAIARSARLPTVYLGANIATPQTLGVMQGILREDEVDELALIRNGLNGTGYIAQHHIKPTPFLCRQLAQYKVRVIVTVRNILDTFVSIDDQFRRMQKASREAGEAPEDSYFSQGFPRHYTEMSGEDRFDFLADRAAWYVQFLMHWQKLEQRGMVEPLWISYERDLLGDRQAMAERIAAHVGFGLTAEAVLAELSADPEAGRLQWNKGVAGRGEAIPTGPRERILKAFAPFRDEADFSLMLGPERA